MFSGVRGECGELDLCKLPPGLQADRQLRKLSPLGSAVLCRLPTLSLAGGVHVSPLLTAQAQAGRLGTKQAT